MAARTMSERRRAFLALQGRTFPRVGDHGLTSEVLFAPEDATLPWRLS